MEQLNLSHYRPTPDQRRFSISTFAVTGQVQWAAKPGGEFFARVDVIKGAFAKMIPFVSMEAKTVIHTVEKSELSTKIFTVSSETRAGSGKASGKPAEKMWNNVDVISPIEIPWVAEYSLSRYIVGGPREVTFSFEDNQRVREAVLFFRDETADGNAMAMLRVMKPGEAPAPIAKTQGAPKPGDVLITFREGKIAGFTVFVPIVGKLQFVAV